MPNESINFSESIISGGFKPSVLQEIWTAQKETGLPVKLDDEATLREKYPNMSDEDLGKAQSAISQYYLTYKSNNFQRPSYAVPEDEFGQRIAELTNRPTFTTEDIAYSPSDPIYRDLSLMGTNTQIDSPDNNAFIKNFYYDRSGELKPHTKGQKRGENDFLQWTQDPLTQGYILREVDENEDIDSNKMISIFGPSQLKTNNKFGSALRGILSGSVGMTVKGTGETVDWIGDVFKQLGGWEDEDWWADSFKRKTGRYAGYITHSNLDERLGAFTNLSSFLFTVGEGVGQVGGMYAMALATGGVSGAAGLGNAFVGTFSSEAALLLGAAQKMGMVREEARNKGIDEGSLFELTGSLSQAATAYLVEKYIGPNRLTHFMGKYGKIATKEAIESTGVKLTDGAIKRGLIRENYNKFQSFLKKNAYADIGKGTKLEGMINAAKEMGVSGFEEWAEEGVEGILDSGIQTTLNWWSQAQAKNLTRNFGASDYIERVSSAGTPEYVRVDPDGEEEIMSKNLWDNEQDDLRNAWEIVKGKKLYDDISPFRSFGEEGTVAAISAALVKGGASLFKGNTIRQDEEEKRKFDILSLQISKNKNKLLPKFFSLIDEMLKNGEFVGSDITPEGAVTDDVMKSAAIKIAENIKNDMAINISLIEAHGINSAQVMTALRGDNYLGGKLVGKYRELKNLQDKRGKFTPELAEGQTELTEEQKTKANEDEKANDVAIENIKKEIEYIVNPKKLNRFKPDEPITSQGYTDEWLKAEYLMKKYMDIIDQNYEPTKKLTDEKKMLLLDKHFSEITKKGINYSMANNAINWLKSKLSNMIEIGRQAQESIQQQQTELEQEHSDINTTLQGKISKIKTILEEVNKHEETISKIQAIDKMLKSKKTTDSQKQSLKEDRAKYVKSMDSLDYKTKGEEVSGIIAELNGMINQSALVTPETEQGFSELTKLFEGTLEGTFTKDNGGDGDLLDWDNITDPDKKLQERIEFTKALRSINSVYQKTNVGTPKITKTLEEEIIDRQILEGINPNANAVLSYFVFADLSFYTSLIEKFNLDKDSINEEEMAIIGNTNLLGAINSALAYNKTLLTFAKPIDKNKSTRQHLNNEMGYERKTSNRKINARIERLNMLSDKLTMIINKYNMQKFSESKSAVAYMVNDAAMKQLTIEGLVSKLDGIILNRPEDAEIKAKIIAEIKALRDYTGNDYWVDDTIDKLALVRAEDPEKYDAAVVEFYGKAYSHIANVMSLIHEAGISDEQIEDVYYAVLNDWGVDKTSLSFGSSSITDNLKQKGNVLFDINADLADREVEARSAGYVVNNEIAKIHAKQFVSLLRLSQTVNYKAVLRKAGEVISKMSPDGTAANLIPSLEQINIAVAMHAYRLSPNWGENNTIFKGNVSSQDQENDTDFSFGMFLMGFGGSGKTAVISPFAQRLYNSISDSPKKALYLVSNDNEALGMKQKVENAFGKENVTVVSWYNYLNGKVAIDFEEHNVIYGDEATSIPNGQFNEVYDKLKESNLPFILIGDPEQVKPIPENGNMAQNSIAIWLYQGNPVITVQRSSVGMIERFQQELRGSSITALDKLPETGYYVDDERDGIVVGVKYLDRAGVISDFIAATKKHYDLSGGHGRTVLIVNDSKELIAMQKTLSDAGLKEVDKLVYTLDNPMLKTANSMGISGHQWLQVYSIATPVSVFGDSKLAADGFLSIGSRSVSGVIMEGIASRSKEISKVNSTGTFNEGNIADKHIQEQAKRKNHIIDVIGAIVGKDAVSKKKVNEDGIEATTEENDDGVNATDIRQEAVLAPNELIKKKEVKKAIKKLTAKEFDSDVRTALPKEQKSSLFIRTIITNRIFRIASLVGTTRIAEHNMLVADTLKKIAEFNSLAPEGRTIEDPERHIDNLVQRILTMGKQDLFTDPLFIANPLIDGKYSPMGLKVVGMKGDQVIVDIHHLTVGYAEKETPTSWITDDNETRIKNYVAGLKAMGILTNNVLNHYVNVTGGTEVYAPTAHSLSEFGDIEADITKEDFYSIPRIINVNNHTNDHYKVGYHYMVKSKLVRFIGQAFLNDGNAITRRNIFTESNEIDIDEVNDIDEIIHEDSEINYSAAPIDSLSWFEHSAVLHVAGKVYSSPAFPTVLNHPMNKNSNISNHMPSRVRYMVSHILREMGDITLKKEYHPEYSLYNSFTGGSAKHQHVIFNVISKNDLQAGLNSFLSIKEKYVEFLGKELGEKLYEQDKEHYTADGLVAMGMNIVSQDTYPELGYKENGLNNTVMRRNANNKYTGEFKPLFQAFLDATDSVEEEKALNALFEGTFSEAPNLLHQEEIIKLNKKKAWILKNFIKGNFQQDVFVELSDIDDGVVHQIHSANDVFVLTEAKLLESGVKLDKRSDKIIIDKNLKDKNWAWVSAMRGGISKMIPVSFARLTDLKDGGAEYLSTMKVQLKGLLQENSPTMKSVRMIEKLNEESLELYEERKTADDKRRAAIEKEITQRSSDIKKEYSKISKTLRDVGVEKFLDVNKNVLFDDSDNVRIPELGQYIFLKNGHIQLKGVGREFAFDRKIASAIRILDMAQDDFPSMKVIGTSISEMLKDGYLMARYSLIAHPNFITSIPNDAAKRQTIKQKEAPSEVENEITADEKNAKDPNQENKLAPNKARGRGGNKPLKSSGNRKANDIFISSSQAKFTIRELVGKVDIMISDEVVFDEKGARVWGNFLEAIITLYNENGVSKFAARHEAMHYMIRHIFTPEQASKILNEAKRRLAKQRNVDSSEISYRDANEYIAERFEDRDNIKSPLNILERAILALKDLLNKIITIRYNIKEIYSKANDGYYSTHNPIYNNDFGEYGDTGLNMSAGISAEADNYNENDFRSIFPVTALYDQFIEQNILPFYTEKMSTSNILGPVYGPEQVVFHSAMDINEKAFNALNQVIMLDGKQILGDGKKPMSKADFIAAYSSNNAMIEVGIKGSQDTEMKRLSRDELLKFYGRSHIGYKNLNYQDKKIVYTKGKSIKEYSVLTLGLLGNFYGNTVFADFTKGKNQWTKNIKSRSSVYAKAVDTFNRSRETEKPKDKLSGTLKLEFSVMKEMNLGDSNDLEPRKTINIKTSSLSDRKSIDVNSALFELLNKSIAVNLAGLAPQGDNIKLLEATLAQLLSDSKNDMRGDRKRFLETLYVHLGEMKYKGNLTPGVYLSEKIPYYIGAGKLASHKLHVQLLRAKRDGMSYLDQKDIARNYIFKLNDIDGNSSLISKEEFSDDMFETVKARIRAISEDIILPLANHLAGHTSNNYAIASTRTKETDILRTQREQLSGSALKKNVNAKFITTSATSKSLNFEEYAKAVEGFTLIASQNVEGKSGKQSVIYYKGSPFMSMSHSNGSVDIILKGDSFPVRMSAFFRKLETNFNGSSVLDLYFKNLSRESAQSWFGIIAAGIVAAEIAEAEAKETMFGNPVGASVSTTIKGFYKKYAQVFKNIKVNNLANPEKFVVSSPDPTAPNGTIEDYYTGYSPTSFYKAFDSLGELQTLQAVDKDQKTVKTATGNRIQAITTSDNSSKILKKGSKKGIEELTNARPNTHLNANTGGGTPIGNQFTFEPQDVAKHKGLQGSKSSADFKELGTADLMKVHLLPFFDEFSEMKEAKVTRFPYLSEPLSDRPNGEFLNLRSANDEPLFTTTKLSGNPNAYDVSELTMHVFHAIDSILDGTLKRQEIAEKKIREVAQEQRIANAGKAKIETLIAAMGNQLPFLGLTEDMHWYYDKRLSTYKPGPAITLNNEDFPHIPFTNKFIRDFKAILSDATENKEERLKSLFINHFDNEFIDFSDMMRKHLASGAVFSKTNIKYNPVKIGNFEDAAFIEQMETEFNRLDAIPNRTDKEHQIYKVLKTETARYAEEKKAAKDGEYTFKFEFKYYTLDVNGNIAKTNNFLSNYFVLNTLSNFAFSELFRGGSLQYNGAKDYFKRASQQDGSKISPDTFVYGGTGRYGYMGILDDPTIIHHLLQGKPISEVDGMSYILPVEKKRLHASGLKSFMGNAMIKDQLSTNIDGQNAIMYMKTGTLEITKNMYQNSDFIKRMVKYMLGIHYDEKKLNDDFDGYMEEVYRTDINNSGEIMGRISFSSAIKTGKHAKIKNLKSFKHTDAKSLLERQNSIIRFNYNDYGIVLNPSQDILNTDKSLPTQMITLLGVGGVEQTGLVRELHDAMIKWAKEEMSDLNNAQEDKWIKEIAKLAKKKVRATGEASMYADLVYYLSEQPGTNKLLPIRNRLADHLFTAISRKTVTPRITGNAYVQAAVAGYEGHEIGGLIVSDEDKALFFPSEKDNKRGLRGMQWRNSEGVNAKSREELLTGEYKNIPAEVITQFHYMDVFGLEADDSLASAMYFEGNMNGLTYDQVMEHLNGLSEEQIDEAAARLKYRRSKMYRASDSPSLAEKKKAIASYFTRLNDALDIVAARIPTSGPNMTFRGRIVAFDNNVGSTLIVSSEKSVLDGSDYDIDQLMVYFRNLNHKGYRNTGKAKGGRDNDLFEIMHKYFDIPSSKIPLTRKVDISLYLKRGEQKLNQLKRFKAGTTNLGIRFREIYRDGDSVGYYATMTSYLSRLFHLPVEKRNALFKNLPAMRTIEKKIMEGDIEKTIKNFVNEDFVASLMGIPNDLVNLSVDNANHLVLGSLNMSKETSAITLGWLLSQDPETSEVSQEEFIDLMSREDVANVKTLIAQKMNVDSVFFPNTVSILNDDKFNKSIDTEDFKRMGGYYGILGLTKSINLSDEQIRAAFSTKIKEESSTTFKEMLRNALEVLLNPELKKYYDAYDESGFDDSKYYGPVDSVREKIFEYAVKGEAVRRLGQVIDLAKDFKPSIHTLQALKIKLEGFMGMSFKDVVAEGKGSTEAERKWLNESPTTNEQMTFAKDHGHKVDKADEAVRNVLTIVDIIREMPNVIDIMRNIDSTMDKLAESNYVDALMKNGQFLKDIANMSNGKPNKEGIEGKLLNGISRIKDEDSIRDISNELNKMMLGYFFSESDTLTDVPFNGRSYNLNKPKDRNEYTADIAARVADIISGQSEESVAINDNEIMQHLSIEPFGDNTGNKILFNSAFDVSGADRMSFIHAWEQLEELDNELAYALIDYHFLVYPLSTGRGNFSNFLTTNYLEKEPNGRWIVPEYLSWLANPRTKDGTPITAEHLKQDMLKSLKGNLAQIFPEYDYNIDDTSFRDNVNSHYKASGRAYFYKFSEAGGIRSGQAEVSRYSPYVLSYEFGTPESVTVPYKAAPSVGAKLMKELYEGGNGPISLGTRGNLSSSSTTKVTTSHMAKIGSKFITGNGKVYMLEEKGETAEVKSKDKGLFKTLPMRMVVVATPVDEHLEGNESKPLGTKEALLDRSKLLTLVKVLNLAFPNIKIVLTTSSDPMNRRPKSKGYTHRGVVYINMDRVTADTPIHEVSHIIIDYMEQYDTISFLDMMQELDSINHEPMIKKIKALYPELSGTDLKKEVLAHIIGFNSMERIDSIAEKYGNKPSFNLKNVVKNIYAAFARTLQKVFVRLGFIARATYTIAQLQEEIFKSVETGKDKIGVHTIVRSAQDFESRVEDGIHNTKHVFEMMVNPDAIEIKTETDLNNAIAARLNALQGKTETRDRSTGKDVALDADETSRASAIREILKGSMINEDVFKRNTVTLLNDKTNSEEILSKVYAKPKYIDDNRRVILEELKSSIGMTKNSKAILASEMKNHKDLTRFYDDRFIGKDPIVIINYGNDGKLVSISIVDINNGETLETRARGKNYAFEGLIDDRLVKKLNIRNSFKNGRLYSSYLFAAHIQKMDPSISIENVGTVHYGINSVDPVMADPVAIKDDFRRLYADDGFKKLIKSPEIMEVVKYAGQNQVKADYMSILINSYKNFHVPNSNNSFERFMVKYEKDELTPEQFKDLLNHRVQILSRNKFMGNADADRERIVLSRALNQLGTPLYSTETMNEFVDLRKVAMAITPGFDIQNDLVQTLRVQMINAERAIVDNTRLFQAEMNKKIEVLRQKWLSIPGNSVFSEQAGEKTHEYMKPLMATEILDGGEEVLSGFVLWTTDDTKDPLNAAQARQRLANGEITPEMLKIGEWFADQVTGQWIQAVKHRRWKQAGRWYWKEGEMREYSDKDAEADLLSKGLYIKGMLPLMSKSVSELTSEGKIRKAIKKNIDRIANPLSPYEENQMSGSDLNSITDQFFDQLGYNQNETAINKIPYSGLGHANRLNVLGLSVNPGNGNIQLDDAEQNNNVSSNIWNMMSYFVMNNQQKIIYEEKVVPMYNAIKTIIFDSQQNKGFVVKNLDKYIDDVMLFEVKQERRKDVEDWMNVNTVKGLEVVTNTVGGMTMFMNANVAILSAATNTMHMFLESILNSMGDVGLFNPRDILRANKIYFSERGKVEAVNAIYHHTNMSEYNLINNFYHKKFQKHMFTNHTTNIGNYATDTWARSVVAIAHMLYIGTWDAHVFDKSDGSVKYDETKDKRWQGQDGAAKLIAYKRIMRNDNPEYLDSQGKLKRGLDNLTASNLRYISNKYIIGAYGSKERVHFTQEYLGRTFGMFTNYIWTRIKNSFQHGAHSTEGGQYIFEKAADGTYVAKWERRWVEGYVNTLLEAIKEVTLYRKNPAKYWSTLNSTQKYNLKKAFLYLGTWLLGTLMFAGWDGDDPEESLIKPKRYLKNFKYALSDLMITNIMWDVVSDGPAAFSIISRAWDISLKDTPKEQLIELSRKGVLGGVGSTIYTVDDMFND